MDSARAVDDHAASAALAEPVVPVRARFYGSMALSNLGLWTAFFAPIQILLAQQMEVLAPGDKESALGWVTGIGALVSLFSNPLFGAWSDRTVSRFGRRHPWNLGGALVGAVALVMLGRQSTLVGVTCWWCVAQLALNAMLAALTAEVPDQVPVAQRAVCSAWVGVTQPLGVVVGALLVTTFGHGIAQGYGLVAVALVACTLPFVLLVRNTPLPRSERPPWDSGAFLRGFWISPRLHPDFAWAWATRFLINLGNAIGTLYMLYFLRDGLHYERLFPGKTSEDGLLIVVAIYTAGVLVGAFGGGMLSDRSGRRKAHVIASSVVMTIAAVMLMLPPNWPLLMAAATVLGLGYGAYAAVDQALITQVLPQAADRGKDLGIINIANSAPQVVAPAIAAILVTRGGGYAVLYLATAVVTWLGGMLVRKIRSVQ
ncbi:MFS transporter [Dyella silvatica]|uniref:MFS transporter n=1 Tax=Dyella silvatica TaxID=2992128 RepID=UPI0022580A6F|nr:MFS transporter [Dyella silvatica]